jgi:hypothetical protein
MSGDTFRCVPSINKFDSIGVGMLVWLVYEIPFVIYYDIKSAFGCLFNNPSVVRFYLFVHLLVLFGLLPCLLASTLGIVAYRNIRQTPRHEMTQLRRRVDRQLTTMILACIIMLLIFLLPFITQRCYLAYVRIDPRDTFRQAWGNLISAITISLNYLNVAVRTTYPIVSLSLIFTVVFSFSPFVANFLCLFTVIRSLSSTDISRTHQSSSSIPLPMTVQTARNDTKDQSSDATQRYTKDSSISHEHIRSIILEKQFGASR